LTVAADVDARCGTSSTFAPDTCTTLRHFTDSGWIVVVNRPVCAPLRTLAFQQRLELRP
jgi:hypothetical protein